MTGITNIEGISPFSGDFKWTENSGDRIGSGTFANVYKGHHVREKYAVAVKCIARSRILKNEKSQRILGREIDILQNVGTCAYIVKLFAVEETRAEIILVMELCDDDFAVYRKANDPSEQMLIRFLSQVAQGVSFLHQHDIVHRDIKPQNVLIKWIDPKKKTFDIKLADFGYARYWDHSMPLVSLAGSPAFMAPEALQCLIEPGRTYNDLVDLWSIGALLYFAIVGEYGFAADVKRIHGLISKKEDALAFEIKFDKVNYIRKLPNKISHFFSQSFLQQIEVLIIQLLKVDPLKRIGIDALVEQAEDFEIPKMSLFFLHTEEVARVAKDEVMTWNEIACKASQLFSVRQEDLLILYPSKDGIVSINIKNKSMIPHFQSIQSSLDMAVLCDTSIFATPRFSPLSVPASLLKLESGTGSMSKGELARNCITTYNILQKSEEYHNTAVMILFSYCNQFIAHYQDIDSQLSLEKAAADAKIDTINTTLELDSLNFDFVLATNIPGQEKLQEITKYLSEIQTKLTADVSFQQHKAIELISHLSSSKFSHSPLSSLNDLEACISVLSSSPESKPKDSQIHLLENNLEKLRTERAQRSAKYALSLQAVYTSSLQLQTIIANFSHLLLDIRSKYTLQIHRLLRDSRELIVNLATPQNFLMPYPSARTPTPSFPLSDGISSSSLSDIDAQESLSGFVSVDNFKTGDTVLLIPHKVRHFRTRYMPVIANTEDRLIFLSKDCCHHFHFNKNGNFNGVTLARLTSPPEDVTRGKKSYCQLSAVPASFSFAPT
ncbi:Inhibitor of nuclear factor kappa-B kinase subunit beta-like [Oopsacas minuta]|uniref:Inhibitor of nuclear factor kappa-B kinase subunit beta-like n=1 Tax=Oopsacas minuta TaxID=111878 RepID=A0AAV7JVB3_9METZ|nr:Inhibitor of nuclear factor kappa-B kinase subunit beta-like [Oopsacas minuta]